jgi:multidrug transporter EmrE-like cation transporter
VPTVSYPNPYLYLTIHWIVQSQTVEGGQIGLKYDSAAPATQSLVDATATAISAFWVNATALIDYDFRLAYARLASIGTNGLYVPGTVAYDHLFPNTPGGGSSGSPTYRFPLQVASVSSLLTANVRGQAHRGRVYLPPIAATLGADYKTPPASANNRTNSFSAMLTALNGVMPGPLSVFSKGSKAAPTVGAKHVVTGVVTGGRLDVQRRRAKSQVESYSIVGNV